MFMKSIDKRDETNEDLPINPGSLESFCLDTIGDVVPTFLSFFSIKSL